MKVKIPTYEEFKANKRENELLKKLNDKQKELVQVAQRIDGNGDMYDKEHILKNRSVLQIMNGKLYTNFSFTKDNMEDKFNREIKQLQTHIDMLKKNRR